MKLPEVSSRIQLGQNNATMAVMTRWRELDISLLWLAALIPALLAGLIELRTPLLVNWVVAIIVLQFWRVIFRLVTHTSSLLISGHDVVYAVLIALLLPLHIPGWQIFIGISFGYVFAECLFGGRGFGFLNPVVLTLSFLLQAQGMELSETPVASISFIWLMPGIVGLIWFELVSYRTIAAVVLAVLAASVWLDYPEFWSWFGASPVMLAIFFLVSDPAATASTNPGRWLHGFLYGLLFSLLVNANPLSLAPAINAALLASLVVPLIDYLVVYIYINRRRQPHA